MSQHEDTTAAWLKEAATDLTAPTPLERMGAVLRWTARVANVKGVLALADRALKQQELIELQCRFRADGHGWEGARDLVMQNAPSDIEMSRARADYSRAVELLELAERIARLLELTRRAAPAKQQPQQATRFGGKR